MFYPNSDRSEDYYISRIIYIDAREHEVVDCSKL